MSNVVEWDELLPIVEEAFNIWVGYPERRWAEKAWAHLTKAGLADASRPLDRVRAYIRFLVLASMYRDWCALVLDEVHDDSPQCWLSAVGVSPFHIGQLVGLDVDIEDPEGDIDETLNVLMGQEREAVVTAVVNGFGGVEDLFVALWRSSKDPDENRRPDDEDDEGEPAAPPETDADILNNDVSPEKMAGYEWIREGCESHGPIRSTAEMDDWQGF